MIRSAYPVTELLRWPLRWLRTSTVGVDRMRRGPREWHDPEAPAGPRSRIVVLGDVMTVWNRAVPLVDPEVRRVVERADLVLANCEAPVVDSGPVGGGGRLVVHHRMHAGFLTGLVAELDSSPDRWIVSIANNHVGDDGPAGIERTQRALEIAGLDVAGRRGWDRSLIVTRDLPVGRIGIACWTRWLNHREFSPDDGVWRHHDVADADWAALRSSHDLDLLLAFPHWDREFCLAPSAETRETARRLVAGGVDLIVGHHPHVAQPWERIDGRPVLYSIGSFHGPLPWIWRAEHRLGWMAEIEITRDASGAVRPTGITIHPVVLVREGPGHALLPLAAAPDADRRAMAPIVDLLFPAAGDGDRGTGRQTSF
jgi:poly-gamma-glutamate synthesis protein (capsule biosynthesis protein)